MKNTMRSYTKLVLALAAALIATGANALSYKWDFQYTANLPSSTITETSITGTGLTAGATIKLYAYSTVNTNTTSNWVLAAGTSAPNSVALPAGFTYQGDLGIGIRNHQEAAGTNEASDGTPGHAIDNKGGYTDIVVIDAGEGNTVDWTKLMIGYGWEGGAGSNGSGSTSGGAGTPEINLWSGNSLPGLGNANLGNNFCFSGCTNSLANLGFTTAQMVNVGNNTLTNTGLNGTPDGRYLVIAGELGDAFKLKQLTATGKIPEPASIALLGLGLVGLGFARRRTRSS